MWKRDRINRIVQAVFSQFSVPLTRIFLSLAVVRLYSEEYWGTYVQYLLIVQLSGAFINLGSRDYLVRAFSRNPEQIKEVLQASILGRLGVALVVVVLLFLIPLGEMDYGLVVAWILTQLTWQFVEALNIYRRLFWQTALIELALILILIGVFIFNAIPLQFFLLFMVASELIKGLCYLALNGRFLTLQAPDFRRMLQFFKSVFPFLLLVLAGAIASRGELYLLAIKLDASLLGKYQVLSNFVQSSHLLASAILLPFLKNLYRLGEWVLFKLERSFLTFGLFLTPLITLFIYVVLHYAYRFQLAREVYYLIGALIFLYFFQAIRMQMLFRQNQVYRATLILLLMGVVKILAGWWLIPSWGISGALVAAVLAYLAGNVAFWQVPIKSLAR